MNSKKEKKTPAKQKLKTAWEGMVRVASAIIPQAGRASVSFIVKMEHMDSMVCCHQSMVLIKANTIYLWNGNVFRTDKSTESGKSFFFSFYLSRMKYFSVTSLGLFVQSLVTQVNQQFHIFYEWTFSVLYILYLFEKPFMQIGPYPVSCSLHKYLEKEWFFITWVVLYILTGFFSHSLEFFRITSQWKKSINLIWVIFLTGNFQH